MELVSKFAESLKDILYDNKITVEELSKATGISKNRIYEWLAGNSKYMPSVAYLVILADFFKCSIDYLAGLINENYSPNPKPCPPFSGWFRTAIERRGYNLYKLSRATRMGTNVFYAWINGTSEPILDSLIRVSAVLDCSIDYLLGRGE